VSKFTKFIERAVASAKPDKEAGLVVAITRERFFVAKVVGDPQVAAQAFLIAANQDPSIQDMLKYLTDQIESNTSKDELPLEPEHQGED
jgi:hypothetical protein